jgi:hypothetical protein
MDTALNEVIKHRDLHFCPLHPDKQQAQSVMLVLGDIDGIENLQLVDNHHLQVSYDIQKLTLQIIETALIEAGYHLDNSLLHRLKRALYYYTEDVQRDNMGLVKGNCNCTTRLFINRYSRQPHGCRDTRPDHWRRYL